MICGYIGLLDHMFMFVRRFGCVGDGLRCGLVCFGEIIVHMMFLLFWMDRVIGGQGSDRLHGSVDQMIGHWENDGVTDEEDTNDLSNDIDTKEEDDMLN